MSLPNALVVAVCVFAIAAAGAAQGTRESNRPPTVEEGVALVLQAWQDEDDAAMASYAQWDPQFGAPDLFLVAQELFLHHAEGLAEEPPFEQGHLAAAEALAA